jgi:hypothetical protein
MYPNNVASDAGARFQDVRSAHQAAMPAAGLASARRHSAEPVAAPMPLAAPPLCRTDADRVTLRQDAREELRAIAAEVAALEAQLGDAVGPPSPVRPSTAPYALQRDDDAESWSGDAHGKSRNPGWFHAHREQLYSERRAQARAAPKGCYVSHSKFADEMVRSMSINPRGK